MRGMLILFFVLVAGSLQQATDEWIPILVSRVDNDDFHYDSPIWESGIPMNVNDTTGEKNVLMPEYSTIYVEKVKIEMNFVEWEFEMEEEDMWKYTLKELATSDGVQVKINEDYGPWRGKNNNKYALTRSGHYYCFEFGFNYPDHPRARKRFADMSRVRIGNVMGLHNPCQNSYIRSAEGIGLDAYYNHKSRRMGSGQLKEGSSPLFSKATVWVKGSPIKKADPRALFVYFPITAGRVGDRHAPLLTFKEHIKRMATDDIQMSETMSMTFFIRLKRTMWHWEALFRYNYHEYPSCYMIADYNNYADTSGVHTYLRYNGRNLDFRVASTNYVSDGHWFTGTADSGLIFGRWTHITLAIDKGHFAVYYDGVPHSQYIFRGDRLTVFEKVMGFSPYEWNPTADMHDVRFYKRFLRADEIAELAASWPPNNCGNGFRQENEECDDGNGEGGDGCSGTCRIESGFVCSGGNTTSSAADICVPGTVNMNITFEEDKGSDISAYGWTFYNSTDKYSSAKVVNTAAFGGNRSMNLYFFRQASDWAIGWPARTSASAFIYAELPITTPLTPTSTIRFNFRMNRRCVNYCSYFITVIREDTAPIPPHTCRYEYDSTNYRTRKFRAGRECESKRFYRMCYNMRGSDYIYSCDEMQQITFGSWMQEEVDWAGKFAKKYGDRTEAYQSTNVRLQFALYTAGFGDDSILDMDIDNVMVSTKDDVIASCPHLTASSDSSGSSPSDSIGVNGVDQSPGATDSFNVMVYNFDQVFQWKRSYASAVTETTFYDDILGLPWDSTVVVTAKGQVTGCGDKCNTALNLIGGLTFSSGSSYALIGRKGAPRGHVPCRAAASGENGVSVSSFFRCHSLAIDVPEYSHQHYMFGPALNHLHEDNFLEGTVYSLDSSSHGYMGCFRDNTDGLGMDFPSLYRCYWHGMSSSWCGKFCYDQGYKFAATYYHHCCACGNRYGTHTCNRDSCGGARYPEKQCKRYCHKGDPRHSCGTNDGTTNVWRYTGKVYRTGRPIGTAEDFNTDPLSLRHYPSELEGHLFSNASLAEYSLNYWDDVYEPHASSAWFDTTEHFRIDASTGQIHNQFHMPDFETTPEYRLVVLARRPGFDSGWFEMKSQDETSYMELDHNMGILPDLVSVRVKAVDGANKDYIFPGVGSAQSTGEFGERYGGLLFAYNENKVRLWAPKENSGNPNGHIINVGVGWGGEENAQGSDTASVQVTTDSCTAADFDSGWFRMTSNDNTKVYKEVSHDLGSLEFSRVSVVYKPISGPNAGFVFEAAGSQMRDDDAGKYGGLIYAYSDTSVRIWAPMNNDLKNDNCPAGWRVENNRDQTCTVSDPGRVRPEGHIIMVSDGWGSPSSNWQIADDADVRVRIWYGDPAAPDYSSEWTEIASSGNAYHQIKTSVGAIPQFFKVLLTPDTGNNVNYMFEGSGASQGVDLRPKMNYGGLVYAYSENYLRMWAPSKSSETINHAFGNLFQVNDGWGDGTNAHSCQAGKFKILLWLNSMFSLYDSSVMKVNVKNVNEPPVLEILRSMVDEEAPLGTYVGEVKAFDPDGPNVKLSYRVVGGPDAVNFKFLPNGTMITASVETLDYELAPNQSVLIEVSDGLNTLVAPVQINVRDVNDPPELLPPFVRYVREDAPVNTFVGEPVRAFDEDVGQAIFFEVAGGNCGEDKRHNETICDVFQLNYCTAQFSLKKPLALDHEGLQGNSTFDIEVLLTDNGPGDVNTTGIIRIIVNDTNDRPWLDDGIRLYVFENSPVDTPVGPPLLNYMHDDDCCQEHYFTLVAMDMPSASDEGEATDPGVTDPGDESPGDEGGDPAAGTVSDPPFALKSNTTGQMFTTAAASLDFESGNIEFSVLVRVVDNGTDPMPFSDDAMFTVVVMDANDPPQFNEAQLNPNLPENQPAGTLVGMVEVTDQDKSINGTDSVVKTTLVAGNDLGFFTYNGETGELRTAVKINYEQYQEFFLTLMAIDDGMTTRGITPNATTNATVHVHMVDVNEKPEVFCVNLELNENSPVGAVLEGGNITSADPDILQNQTIAFTIQGGNTNGSFAVNPLTGQVYVSKANVDFEAVPSYQLRIRGTDDGPGRLFSECLANVTVHDVNDPPKFACQPSGLSWLPEGYCGNFSVAENSVNGTVVGRVPASDEDRTPVQELAYSFSNAPGEAPASSHFTVDSATGDVKVQLTNGATLNFEEDPRYFIAVTATDDGTNPSPLATTQYFVVNVFDVPEPPVLLNLNRTCSNEANNGDKVMPSLSADDEDANSVLTYSCTGGRGSTVFEVKPNGNIYVINQTEVQKLWTGKGPQNVYPLDVMVMDERGLNDTGILYVELVNTNHVPLLAPQNFSILENATASTVIHPAIVCTDGADAEQFLSYSLFENSLALRNLFSLNTLSGQGPYGQNLAELVLKTASLDFEKKAVYAVQITCTDIPADADELSLSNSTTAYVHLINVNDAPVFGGPAALSVPENSPTGTVVGTVTWNDEDTVNGWGDLTITAVNPGNFTVFQTLNNEFEVRVGAVALDFESRVHYTLDVQAVDGGGIVDSKTLSITVLDVNEPPVLSFATDFTIPESSPVGKVIATMRAWDPDATSVLYPTRLDYSVVSCSGKDVWGNTQPLMDYTKTPPTAVACDVVFTTSELSGDTAEWQVKVGSQSAIDYEDIVEYEVTIMAQEISTTPQLSGNATMTVKLTDVNDVRIIARNGLGKVVNPFSKTNFNTSGGDTVQISGLNFGTRHLQGGNIKRPITVTYGTSGVEYTATDCTIITANTVMECTVAEGVGSMHIWTVSIGSHVSRSDASPEIAAFSTAYAPPTVTAVAIASGSGAEGLLQTHGGDKVVIEGTNLGASSAATIAMVGNVRLAFEGGKPVMRFDLDATLPCRAARAFQKEFVIAGSVVYLRRALAGGALHAIQVTAVSSYAVRGSRVAFCIESGDIFPAPVVTLNLDQVKAEIGDSDLELAGSWEVYMNTRPTGHYRNLDFDEQSPSANSTKSSWKLYTLGFPNTVGAVYGLSGCTMVTPHTKMECSTPKGVGSDFQWVVTVGGQRSNILTVDSVYYHPPVLQLLDSRFAKTRVKTTAGNETVWIYGAFFGDQSLWSGFGRGDVTYGPFPYSATDCHIDESLSPTAKTAEGWKQNKLICKTSPGVGSGLRWRVSVGLQQSALSVNTTSYMPPVISTITGAGARLCPTRGDVSVSITGAELGPLGEYRLDWVRYGSAAQFGTGIPEKLFWAERCSVVEEYEKIECTMGQGTGRGLSWRVSIGDQLSNLLAANTSYAPPIVSTFDTEDGKRIIDEFSTKGNQTIIIQGSNFGPAASSTRYTAPIEAFCTWTGVKFVASNCSVLLNTPEDQNREHRQIMCTTPAGVGANLKWVVYVDGQRSVQATTSYGAPFVTSVTGGEGISTLGGNEIVIRGRNFGPYIDPVARTSYLNFVTYGAYGAENKAFGCVLTVEHEEITCTTVSGKGKNLRLTVTIGEQSNNPEEETAARVSYMTPVIEEFVPTNGTTYGRYNLRIGGHSFAAGARVTFDGVDIPVDTHDLNHEYVVITCPHSQGANLPVHILHEVGRDECNQISEVAYFSYLEPRIDRLLTESESDGSKRLTLIGPQPQPQRGDTYYANGGSFGAFPAPTLENYVYVYNYTANVTTNPATLPDSKPDTCVPLFNTKATHPDFDEDFEEESVMWSDNKIVCKIYRDKGHVVVSVGGRKSLVKTYENVSPLVELKEYPPVEERVTSGGFNISFEGRYFGPVLNSLEVLLYDNDAVNTVGGEPLMNYVDCPIVHFNDSIKPCPPLTQGEKEVFTPCGRLTCTVPAGQGSRVSPIIRRGGPSGQLSDYKRIRGYLLPEGSRVGDPIFDPVFAYASPIIDSISIVDPSGGGVTKLAEDHWLVIALGGVDGTPFDVVIEGKNFGKHPVVYLGHVQLKVYPGNTHTYIKTQLVGSVGQQHPLQLLVGDQFGSINYISFSAPNITSVLIDGEPDGLSPTVGGSNVTITGSGFGTSYSFSTVRPEVRLAKRLPGLFSAGIQCNAECNSPGDMAGNGMCNTPYGSDCGGTDSYCHEACDSLHSTSDMKGILNPGDIVHLPSTGNDTGLSWQEGTRFVGSKIPRTRFTAEITAAFQCLEACSAEPECRAWSFDPRAPTEALRCSLFADPPVDLMADVTTCSICVAGTPGGVFVTVLEVTTGISGYNSEIKLTCSRHQSLPCTCRRCNARGTQCEWLNTEGLCSYGDDALFPDSEPYLLVPAFVSVGPLEAGTVLMSTRPTSLDILSWEDDKISLLSPPGQGKGYDLTVHSGTQSGNTVPLGGTVKFSYAPPTLSGVFPDHGPTSGLDTADAPILVVVNGTNFGEPSSLDRSVVFHNKVFGTDTPVSITKANHTHIEFYMPAGQGDKVDVLVTVAGQQSNPIGFVYDAPVITSMTPVSGRTDACVKGRYEPVNDWLTLSSKATQHAKMLNPAMYRRKCLEPQMITLSGTSFGTIGATVTLDGRECSLDTDLCPDCTQTHRLIRCLLPKWYGEKLSLELALDGRTAVAPVEFSYNKPSVSAVKLGTITHGYRRSYLINGTEYNEDAKEEFYDRLLGLECVDETNAPVPSAMKFVRFIDLDGISDTEYVCDDLSIVFHTESALLLEDAYNAEGDKLTFHGANFGGVSTEVDVTLGSVLLEGSKPIAETIDCQNATWTEEGDQGLPVLECISPRTSVGAKSYEIAVALQETGEKVNYLYSTPKIGAVCKCRSLTTGKKICGYGSPGELCVDCPVGAICLGNTYDEPWAANQFWRRKLDPVSSYGQLRCPEERKKKEYCLNFVACQPQEACKGNNTCTVGYEHAFYKCQEKRSTFKDNSCITDSDCDPNPVKDCSVNKPEDCAICVNRTQILADGSKKQVGECTCVPATRCALCTIGTHFRINGACEKCPDNPELLIAMFVAGALCACLAGYILNRKNFNLSFISIGVDYFQVLALFASSDIQWPQVMKDIFKWLSAFNFNIDITAPECAMPELTFEMKWYGTIALPIAAGIIFLLIHIVKIVWKRCILCNKMGAGDHVAQLKGIYLVLLYYCYLIELRRALEIFNCSPAEPDDGFTYASFTSVNCEGSMCRCWESGSVQMGLVPIAILAFLLYSVGYPAFVAYTVVKHKELIKEDQILRAMGLGDNPTENPNAFDIRKSYHKMYYAFKPGKVYWILFIIMRKFFIAFAGLMFRGNAGFQLAFVMLVLFISFVLQMNHRPFMSSSERQEVLMIHEAKAKTDRMHKRIAQRIDAQLRFRWRDVDKRKIRLGQRGGGAAKAKQAQEFFWDYNTVEALLLCCSVLVALSGVMFQSGRFENPSVTWQRDLITVIVMTIIALSLIYYTAVFCSEVCGSCNMSRWWIVRKFASKQKSKELAAAAVGANVVKEQESIQLNPMFQGRNVDTDAMHMSAAELREKYVELTESNAKLKESIKALEEATPEEDPKKVAAVTAVRKKRGPKAFGKAARGGARGASRGRGRGRGGTSTQKTTAAPTGDVFVACVDPNSGSKYYYNKRTRETTWTLPKGATVVES